MLPARAAFKLPGAAKTAAVASPPRMHTLAVTKLFPLNPAVSLAPAQPACGAPLQAGTLSSRWVTGPLPSLAEWLFAFVRGSQG